MSIGEKLRASMDGVSLSELDPNNIGSWPAVIRFAVCLIVMLVVIGLGYKLYIEEKQETLTTVTAEEGTLKQTFESKAREAANLEEYKEQLVIMESTFGALLKQLPSDTEVPGLLEDITSAGLNSGLEFEEIKLQPEVVQEFYIELPINVKVQGNYHDLATFISAVASMPRIVTLHDFDLKPVENSTSRLALNIVLKTYRYKEQGDDA